MICRPCVRLELALCLVCAGLLSVDTFSTSIHSSVDSGRPSSLVMEGLEWDAYISSLADECGLSTFFTPTAAADTLSPLCG